MAYYKDYKTSGMKTINRKHREQLQRNLISEIQKYDFLDQEDLLFCINMVKHQLIEGKI